MLGNLSSVKYKTCYNLDTHFISLKTVFSRVISVRDDESHGNCLKVNESRVRILA
jgi:hypothetical protein